MTRLQKIFLLLFVYMSVALPVRADYVLPYPSYMPGNRFYTLAKIFEALQSYWYWGSIGQIKYHMNLADKYLVEAKTLFEYKQYLLALKALKVSDHYIELIPLFMKKAVDEGKSAAPFKTLFRDELLVHKQVLEKLKDELPADFTWSPEKATPIILNISDELSASQHLRESLIE